MKSHIMILIWIVLI